jgi:hypothetical protein
MKTPKNPDLGATLEHSRSGLRDNHRRSLARLLFLFTASALAVFALLQWFNGYAWISAVELSASGLLFLGARRLGSTPYLHRWIYSFLVVLFAFFLAIMLLPEASVA